MFKLKSSNAISIDLTEKNFTLLVINIHTTCMKTVQLELTEKIKNAPYSFSKNTPVIINIAKINRYADWFNLYKTISNIGLFIIGYAVATITH